MKIEAPIQYQEGKARFLDMDIMVDERVLIPRPETELLVSVIKDLCREKKWEEPLMLDVGTGSGAISIGLVKSIPGSRVIASDVSSGALCVAGENVKRLECDERVTLVESDMFKAFNEEYFETFDVVASNPPYVSKKDYEKLDAWVLAEPRSALYAGDEGMDYLNVLAEESEKFLKRGGLLALEVGYDQAGKVREKLRMCGFDRLRSFKDLSGYDRVIVGWKHG
jgi:release factor glutamine methyltransferase